jgi:hypothetical protein
MSSFYGCYLFTSQNLVDGGLPDAVLGKASRCGAGDRHGFLPKLATENQNPITNHGAEKLVGNESCGRVTGERLTCWPDLDLFRLVHSEKGKKSECVMDCLIIRSLCGT